MVRIKEKMEALRLEGNQYFSTNPSKAAEYYEKAMHLYEESTRQLSSAQDDNEPIRRETLEEYCKCAGNALIALFQAKDFWRCVAVAKRALSVNPIFAKANAFWGKAVLHIASEERSSALVFSRSILPSSLSCSAYSSLSPGEASLMLCCRALLQHPGLRVSVHDSLMQSLERNINERATRTYRINQDKEEEQDGKEGEEVDVRVEKGLLGNGVVAYSALPAGTILADLRCPFSVGIYEEYSHYGDLSGRVSGSGKRNWIVCIHCGLCEGEAVEDSFSPMIASFEKGEEYSPKPSIARMEPQSCECCNCAVMFCSLVCKEAHARQHSFECLQLTKLHQMMRSLDEGQVSVPENFFELAFHTITTIAAIRSSSTPGGGEAAIAAAVVQQLESHSQEVAQHVHPSVDLVFELFNGAEEKGFIAEIIGILKCNAIEIVETGSGTGVAQGLYADNAASFFNHSCLPNCTIDPKEKVIVTARSIEKGEALTISYIPQLYWPTNLRKDVLQEQYFFTCCCPRCTMSLSFPSPSSCGPSGGKKGSEMPSGDVFEKSLAMELRVVPRSSSSFSTSSPTSHFHPIVQAACYRIRSLPVEALKVEMMKEVESLLKEVSQYFFPFHYLCHEIQNTLSFLYAVFRREEECFISCMQELLMWESILPGSFPIKKMKIQNCIQCLQEIKAQKHTISSREWEEALLKKTVLGPYLHQLALLYDV